MKTIFIVVLLLNLSTELSDSPVWGFFSHKKINELAIYTLPEEIIGFYKSHKEAIVSLSISADKRRYVVDQEGPKHYIDIDKFEDNTLPMTWQSAVEHYGEDSLYSHGVLPWNILWTYYNLVDAMADHDITYIVKLSADLGHYVADAHVPLHTISNYNGQFTQQEGIHAFWESRLPELYFDQYDFFVGTAIYEPNPFVKVWKTIYESNSLVDSVLSLDKWVTSKIGDKKYVFEKRGRKMVKVETKEFSKIYHDKFPYINQQMAKSVLLIGSLWYSAWIEAGQPPLSTNENPMDKILLDSLAVLPSREILQTRKHEH